MSTKTKTLSIFISLFIFFEAIIVAMENYERTVAGSSVGVVFDNFFFLKIIFASIFVFLSLLFIYKATVSAEKLKEAFAKTEEMSSNLRAINKNFSGVLNSINAIIYVADTKKQEILFANNYAMLKFGEIVGKASYFATKNPNELLPMQGESASYEYLSEITNEWYSVTENLSVWMDGQTVKVTICLDITGRKIAEEKLEKINEHLEEMVDKAVSEVRQKDKLLIQQSKMAAMGEMIGAIAHQWRQPLNALGLMIQDFRLSYQLNDLNPEYVEKITGDAMGQVKYMSKTIDDFRNFFRPDKPKSIFKIQDCVNDVLKIASSQLTASKVEAIINFEDEILEVDGYENEFKQVVLNLITNAKDAIVDNSKADEDILGRIYIDAYKEDGKAILTITDNGGGIKDSVLEKIFEPYFTTKDQGKGTGIGLYMCKMIIEDNMNGSIFAFNHQDGARFQVELALGKIGGAL
jgi:signal transduction histidine kinase